MSTLLVWSDLLVVDAGGGRISLRSVGGEPVGDVCVALPEPWVLSDTVRDADTLSQVWTCGEGEVTVRHAWGALWHLSITGGATRGPAPTPVLTLDPAPGIPGAWLWGAGASARAVLWLPEAGLLELRQLRGEAEVVEVADGRRGLALAPGVGGVPAVCRWRIEPLSGWTQVAAGLPAWLPHLAVEAGDIITLQCPDAGIETDLPAGRHDLATEITVPAGVHRIIVHEAGGPVRLDVHGAPLPSDDLVRRASRLARLDPRSLGPAQVWLAEQAAEQFDGDFLDAVAERALGLAVSAASPDPFALAAAAMGLGRADPREVEDLVADLVRAARRWSEPPVGALLAGEWIARAGALAGLSRVGVALERPRGGSLRALEYAVITGRDPQAGRLITWALDSLGRQLPGVPAQGLLGPLVGLLQRAPARWLSEGGSETLSLRVRQVLSGPDEEAAWLWW